MARFGQGDAPRMNGSGRKWSADELTLKPSERSNECRVCGQPIAAGEMSWAFAWNAGERAHEGCGFYSLRDARAVQLVRALLARWAGGPKLDASILIAAHDAFLIYMRGAEERGRWVERPIAATIHFAKLRLQILALEGAPVSARPAVSNTVVPTGTGVPSSVRRSA